MNIIGSNGRSKWPENPGIWWHIFCCSPTIMRMESGQLMPYDVHDIGSTFTNLRSTTKWTILKVPCLSSPHRQGLGAFTFFGYYPPTQTVTRLSPCLFDHFTFGTPQISNMEGCNSLPSTRLTIRVKWRLLITSSCGSSNMLNSVVTAQSWSNRLHKQQLLSEHTISVFTLF